MRRKVDYPLSGMRYRLFSFLFLEPAFMVIIGAIFGALFVCSIIFQWPLLFRRDLHNTFLYLAALQIAILAILVTSYVFLSTVVRGRGSLEHVMANTLNTTHLIRTRVIFVSCFSIITAILMHFDAELNPCPATVISFKKFIPLFLFWASLCLQVITLFLIISIIAHKFLFFLTALRDIRNSFKGQIDEHSSTGFFQRITDLEKMVKQVYKSHANQLADYFTEQDALNYIFTQKKQKEMGSFIEKYMGLLDFRNNSIIIKEKSIRDVSEIVNVEEVKKSLDEVEKFFLTNLFSNEYFRDLTISSRDFKKAVFKNTTFDKITFWDSILDGANFTEAKLKSCLFNNVSFKDTRCEYTDFSYSQFSSSRDDSEETFFKGEFKLDHSKFDDVRFAALRFTPTSHITIKYPTFRRAYMQNGTIKNMEFKHAVFDGANLCNATICNVKFTSSILENVNFNDAKISQISGKQVIFNNSIFLRSIIENCNDEKFTLHGAKLESTNFSKATLKNIDLTTSICNNADFSHTTLKNVSIARASLVKTQFTETKMEDVDFSFSLFENSNISNVNVTAKDKEWNEFEKTGFINVRFSCKPENGSESTTKILRSHFNNTFFSHSFFMGLTFRSCFFEHSTILDTRSSHVVFEDSRIEHVVFNSSRLISVSFRSTKEKICFKGLSFKECEFDNVSFSNITLKEVNFHQCNFLTDNEIFNNVDLENVVFTDCRFPSNKSMEPKEYEKFFRGTNIEGKPYAEAKAKESITIYLGAQSYSEYKEKSNDKKT